MPKMFGEHQHHGVFVAQRTHHDDGFANKLFGDLFENNHNHGHHSQLVHNIKQVGRGGKWKEIDDLNFLPADIRFLLKHLLGDNSVRNTGQQKRLLDTK